MSTPISNTPDNYKETKLYKRLAELEKENNLGFVYKVDTLISKLTPMLETIGRGPFGDFTLHNPLHSRKLLHLAGYIIPESTLSQLSQLEIAVMIMSFYIHDIGMVVGYKEEAAILSSPEFKSYLISKPEFESRIESLRKEIEDADKDKRASLEFCLQQVLDAAVTDYVRPNHADKKRYIPILDDIKKDNADIFSYMGSSFENYLLDVCSSHNDKTARLVEKDDNEELIFKTDLFFKDQSLNLQYCAAVLRLSDIMDFDRERTPKILFNAIGIQDRKLPGFKISLTEWNKQQAIRAIVLNENEILVEADCGSPNIEKAIAKMCEWIEQEIRNTSIFIRRNPADVTNKYSLDLPLIVRFRPTRSGYVYKDYSVHLNESSIIKLLMGHNLYDTTQVAIRELIQNSIDACRVKQQVSKSGYIPSITVYIEKPSENETWLVVKDNGIGMDDKVLTNFFFKVGNSYYRSSDFKSFSARNGIKNFNPISRFGIGILSVFMIGDTLKVTTKNEYSYNGDKKQRQLIIDNTETLAIVRESEIGENGTTMELRLKLDNKDTTVINRMFGYVRECFIRPEIPITLKYPDGTEHVIKDRFIDFKPNTEAALDKLGIKAYKLDLSKHSDVIRGFAFFIFFNDENGTLSFTDKTGKYCWGKGPLKASEIFDNSNSSSRLTVSGIQMKMKKIGSMFNMKNKQLICVLDVDVEGNENIEYDVRRSSITSHGLLYLRKELLEAIDLALKTEGIYENFDKETLKQYAMSVNRKKPTSPLDKDILHFVDAKIPIGTDSFSDELVEDIAKRLHYDNSFIKPYVYAAIDIRNKKK